MTTKFLIFTLIMFFSNIFGQELTGSWHGELDVQGNKLPLIIHIEKDINGYKSNFDSPLQGAKGIPFQKIVFENNILTLDASNLGIIYTGKVGNDKIDGTFSQSGMNLPLVLIKKKGEETVINRPQTPKPPYNYDIEEVSFDNATDKNILAGTISQPKNFDKNAPILIMITGSGAQNRDEELFGHKPFAVIADDFAKKGIATLRMDDRGTGLSSKGNETDTSENLATDINSAVEFLKGKGYKNIGLIGHSEGGMIAPIVADKNKNVKFLVLLAAPGISTSDLLQKQSYDIGKSSGASETTLETNKAVNQKIYEFVKNYNGNNLKTDLKPILISEFKKFPKGEIPADQIETVAEKQASQISNPWFQYFIKFNPGDYLSKIKIPVLAINGSLDLQVSAKENLAGIKKSLEKAGNKNFEVIEFEGLNHLFQTAITGNPAEYGQIEETISPKVLEKMTAWILQNKF